MNALSGIRVFSGPGEYIQGPGALKMLPEVVSGLGAQCIVFVDAGISQILTPQVTKLLKTVDLRIHITAVSGEVTRTNIADHHSRIPQGEWGTVVGVGGGKALDVAKGVADLFGARMITVPTIASNDGPTARSYAVYNDEHVLVEVGRLPQNPACVIVDSSLIAGAPLPFLLSGIGDALAKHFEANSCAAAHGLTPHGTRALGAGQAIATASYLALLRHGELGVDAARRGEVDTHLEAVIEAVVLLSGLGFENGGLSIAHALTRGLMSARGVADKPHGFHVAYGLLVQLALEKAPEQTTADVRDFMHAVGLPANLGELGMADPTEADFVGIAHGAQSAPHLANTTAEASVANLVAAMSVVEKGLGLPSESLHSRPAESRTLSRDRQESTTRN